MKLRLTCTGTRPLLMHNERLASPLNSYSRRIAELTAVRGKTEDQLWQIARLEFEGGLYFDEALRRNGIEVPEAAESPAP